MRSYQLNMTMATSDLVRVYTCSLGLRLGRAQGVLPAEESRGFIHLYQRETHTNNTVMRRHYRIHKMERLESMDHSAAHMKVRRPPKRASLNSSVETSLFSMANRNSKHSFIKCFKIVAAVEGEIGF